MNKLIKAHISIVLPYLIMLSLTLSSQQNANFHSTNQSILTSTSKINSEPVELSKTKFISSNNYVGYDFVWPSLKKGWQNNGPWLTINAQGAFYDPVFIRMGVGFGNAFNLKNGESIQQFGNYKFIGVFFKHPIRIVRNIIAIEPEIGLDFISAQFKDDPTKNPNSVGFGLTPGIGIKFGPVKLTGKYTTSFAYSIGDKTNAWNGGMNYPSLGLMFETGWGLMSPKKIVSKGIITFIDVKEYFSHSEIKGDYIIRYYKRVTNYTDHTVKSTVHDTRPFWFIAPKLNSSHIIDKDNFQTLQTGAELGFRAGFIGGDVFTHMGKQGFKSPVDKEILKNQYGYAPDLTGSLNAQSYGGKIGVEIMSFLTKIFVHSHEDESIYKATRFTRFLISYGMGQSTYTGVSGYTSEFGEQQLNDFYILRPDLANNINSNPSNISTSNFNVFAMRLEMGVVSLGYEKYTYKQNPILNYNSLNLAYMIPPGRIFQKVRILNKTRKATKQYLKEEKLKK